METSELYTMPLRQAPDFTPEFSHAIHRNYVDPSDNLTKTMTYIWLTYGRGLWVFPLQFTDCHMYCYGWHHFRWIGMDIPKRDIIAYY